MKEKLIKYINRIYFGIYLYTRELDIPIYYVGRKDYYRGQLGFKICCLMIMLYASGFLSIIVFLVGEQFAYLIKSNFIYKIIYIILLLCIYFLFSQITSLEGNKGLAYFEQFDQEPHSIKIKWMVIGAFAFILGIAFFILGMKIFPIF